MSVHVLRTPDDRFVDLPDFPFAPHYVDVPAGPTVDGDVGRLRVHYVDEGAPDAEVVLLLHGEPTWSYLYRHMVPVIVDARLRCIAPDLVGFGRSDKPASRVAHTYQAHVDWMRALVESLDLRRVTLVGQDWGGLIGLRLAAEDPDRFDRIVAANTFLPTGDRDPGPAFAAWQAYSQDTPVFHTGTIVRSGCIRGVTDDVVAAYDAPFPDETYKEGPRQMPLLVPTRPDDPAAPANRAAWKVLQAWDKPFLTAFSDGDPITRGAERIFQATVPGAAGRTHPVVAGAGHFLQEDNGPELARIVADFVHATRA